MQLWWLTSKGARQWSIEERRARWAIYAVALPIFAFLFFLGLTIFTSFLHVPQAVALLLSLAAAGYPALFISRPLCAWVWPDLMRKADSNAANRLGLRRV